jgi:fumarate reductase subunit C
MTEGTSERRPYRRAMPAYWWAKKPYLGYTIRELTGGAVALYGAILLAGLYALHRGPEPYETFVRTLTEPWASALHVVLLTAVLWHAVTWFTTLPKTMPKPIVNGQPVPDGRITALGIMVAVAASVALVVIVQAVSQ